MNTTRSMQEASRGRSVNSKHGVIATVGCISSSDTVDHSRLRSNRFPIGLFKFHFHHCLKIVVGRLPLAPSPPLLFLCREQHSSSVTGQHEAS
jgi:hypothetical protein